MGSDDTIFQQQIVPYQNVIEWVIYRFENWSGRVFSEAFIYLLSPAPFILWQLITIIMYALFCGITFLYYRLFTRQRSQAKDYFMLIFAMTSLFLTHYSVLADGALWMTGSIVYFWSTVLGLVSVYPIISSILTGKTPRLIILIPSLLAGLVAAASQEQVGAVLVGLIFILLLYKILQIAKGLNKSIPWYALFLLIVVLFSFIFSISAPGNGIRVELETTRWLPDFYTIPVVERFEFSYRWFLDAIINHTGYLLTFSWIMIALLFFAKAKKRAIEYIFAAVFLMIGILSLVKNDVAISYWFEFYATWHPEINNQLVALNVIPWTILLILTLFAPLLIFKRQWIGLFISILFLASFGAAAIMTFSPTMYASSWRSLLVPSVILIFISYLLLDRLIDSYKKSGRIFIIASVGLSGSQYLYQLVRLLKS